MFLLSSIVYSQDFEEGIHYRVLDERQTTQTGDRIEVRELFWYHCPHCYSLERPLREWVETMPESAEFISMPAILGDSWEFHARVYYTLE
ncbi:MAG: thiol:disulfide interchange protein DsbA/DsbL, partial [Proteobacteria bacterium]